MFPAFWLNITSIVFDDRKSGTPDLLSPILRAVLVPTVVLCGLLAETGPAESRSVLWSLTVAMTAAIVLALLIARKGNARAAAGLLLFSLFGVTTAGIATYGGVPNPATAAYLVAIVCAGLLLGGRWAAGFAALCALAIFGVEYAENLGWLSYPFEPIDGWQAWLLYSGLFGVMAALVHVAYTSIRSALGQATRAYEESQRQARELTSLYETAVAVSNVPETRELLARLYDQVSRLIAPDTFAVVLCEPEGEWIELAMVMEAGEPLKEAQGLKVRMDEGGLTSWVIRSRVPLLVGDLQRDALPVRRPAPGWGYRCLPGIG